MVVEHQPLGHNMIKGRASDRKGAGMEQNGANGDENAGGTDTETPVGGGHGTGKAHGDGGQGQGTGLEGSKRIRFRGKEKRIGGIG